MANTSGRYIPKLNDRDVIRAFAAVASKFSEQGSSLAFNDQLGSPTDEDVEKYKKLHAYFLTAATIKLGSSFWQWTRLRPESGDANSAHYDKLSFGWDRQQGAPDRRLVAELTAALDIAISRPLALNEHADVDPSTTTSHRDVLLALESTAAQVLTEASAHRQALELAYLDKEKTLSARVDEILQREQGRLTEEKSRVDQDLADRKSMLDGRAAQLDALQKTLDDRNNTHVRREIRSSLMLLTKERLANFSVSRATRFQYIAVHAVSIVGILALAGAAAWFGTSIKIDPVTAKFPPELIALAVKSGALAAAAIALGSWYLGWLNRWLQRIADAEFRLQQFRLDIERASWLAETVLEWNGSSKEPFPELLASRLSTGLFQSTQSEVDDPKTPASQLAEALFGAAASAKLKLGEQELSLDRRAIRDLQK